MRLDVRLSPATLARPSPAVPSLLVVRPVAEAGLDSSFEVECCFAECRKLLRRLAAALGGRDARRAAGLSSLPWPLLSSVALDMWRPDAVVRPEAGVLAFAWGEDPGVERIGSLSFAGVAGERIGLAKDRTGRCAGVVDPEERADGGEERAEDRLKGLLTGIDERLPVLRRNSGRSPSFRNGEGVVRVNGLKLCPTTVSRICVSEFQRGFGPGRSVGVFARAWLAAVPAIARDGVKSKRADDPKDLRGAALVLRGTLEYRRLAGNAGFEAAPLT